MPARVRFEPRPARSRPRWNSLSSAASQSPASFKPWGTKTSRKRPIACAPPIATRETPSASRFRPCMSARASSATRSLVPSRSTAARGLELKRRQVELGLVLDGGERDREVLDREAGRVERRDLVVALPPGGGAVEHSAELGDPAPLELAGFDRVHELAVMAGLLPVVGED